MIKAMIVDDETLIRTMIRMKIDKEKLDIEVVGEFGDSASALEGASTLKPDIIISDICMPGEDGISFSEKCRDILPGCRVIIVTGYNDFEYARRSIRAGVFDYLMKPVNTAELNATLKKAIQSLDANERKSTSAKNLPYDEYKEKTRRLLARLTAEPDNWMQIRNAAEADLKDLCTDNIIQSLECSRIREEVYYIIYFLYLECCVKDAAIREPKKYKEFRAIGTYTMDNISDDNLSASFIQEKFSCSSSYLTRLFRLFAKMPYMNFLSLIRLNEMIRIMGRSPDMKDREIGEKIGIKDAHYLSIWFRKMTGYSVSGYRRAGGLIKGAGCTVFRDAL
jgi:YesN/AraC family two-component response regulator